jgi:NSS family neurotransmitter:Na+ symporter
LPVLIIGMWVYGVYDLFMEATAFELTIDLIIVLAVLLIGLVLTRLKPRNAEE